MRKKHRYDCTNRFSFLGRYTAQATIIDGLDTTSIILGADIERMSDPAWGNVAEKATVFARDRQAVFISYLRGLTNSASMSFGMTIA